MEKGMERGGEGEEEDLECSGEKDEWLWYFLPIQYNKLIP